MPTERVHILPLRPLGTDRAWLMRSEGVHDSRQLGRLRLAPGCYYE